MNKHGLFDIQGTWHVPLWQTRMFYWGVLSFLCVILGIVLIRMVIRYRAKKAQLPLWEQSILELETLKKGGIVSANHSKEFYLALTQIIKKYLQGRYGIECLGKTDDELLAHLTSIGFEPQAFSELQSIFSGMLDSKFANIQGVQERVERDWQRSIAFIRLTIPRPS